MRQALAALSRDGWIMSTYPRGYVVLGARIPWISRLRLLSDEPWKVEVVSAIEGIASVAVAEDLAIAPDARVAIRTSQLGSATSEELWGLEASYYPLDGVDVPSTDTLSSPNEITYGDLELTFGRRIVGYRETDSRPATIHGGGSSAVGSRRGARPGRPPRVANHDGTDLHVHVSCVVRTASKPTT